MSDEDQPNSAICQSCRQKVPLRKDGTFVDHRKKKAEYPLKTPMICPMSNKKSVD